MKVKMTGHDKPNVTYVSADKLKSKGQKKGYFHTDIVYNDKSNPIEVTFENTTYIDKALAGKEKQAVLDHEKTHFSDFKKLAATMKTDIEALKDGSNAKMADRIEWLKYDRCVKSAEFHRRTAGYSAEICDKPSSQRPTK